MKRKELSEHQKTVIQELANNDMNILRAATAMNFHRNSICYHIDCIRRKTGLDPRKFFDLLKLLQMVEKESNAE